MFQVAVMLGADPAEAATQLKESLMFEIKLANASLPREERRNATKLYHPMTLSEMDEQIKFHNNFNWTNYINRILTDKIIQVSEQNTNTL